MQLTPPAKPELEVVKLPAVWTAFSCSGRVASLRSRDCDSVLIGRESVDSATISYDDP